MSVQASKPDNCFIYAVQCVQTKGTNGREGESWSHSVEESIISLWLQQQSEVTLEPSFRHVCVLGVFLLSRSNYSTQPESVHSKKITSKIKKREGERKSQRKRLPVNTRGTHSLLWAVSQHFLNPLVKQKLQHFARKHEDIPIIRIRTRNAACWAEYILSKKRKNATVIVFAIIIQLGSKIWGHKRKCFCFAFLTEYILYYYNFY